MKTYRHVSRPVEGVTAAEAYERTVRACNTLARLPGLPRLGAGSSWPKEFEHHAEAIRWAVFKGVAREDKRYQKLRAQDFGDIYLGPPDDDDIDHRTDKQPVKRADIADAMIAGGWFNALALLEWNIDEFTHACREWQRGRRGRPWVDDQKIIWRHARGVSLRTIGTELSGGKLNEHQVEHRLTQISGHLADIANGRARLVDPLTRPGRQAHGRGRAKADLATD